MSWLVAYKNSSGKIVSWVYRYWVGKKQKEKSTRQKDRAAAVRVQKQWDASLLLYGKFPDQIVKSDPEVNQIENQIERFLLRKKAEIKLSTVKRYESQFAALKEFLARNHVFSFNQLNRSLMIDFKVARLNQKKSHKTVSEELLLFRTLIRSLVEEEVLELDPVKKWPEVSKRIPSKPDTLGPYSDEEVAALLEFFKKENEEFFPAAMTAFYAGLRSGEIRNLRVCDINFVAGSANVYNQKSVKDTKSAHRTVTLHPELLKILKKKCKSKLPTAWIFDEMRLHLHHWPPRQIQKACKALNIQYRRFHGCRHTFATKAANSGVGLPKVQAQLGHTNLATTQKYIKQNQMDSKEIALISFK